MEIGIRTELQRFQIWFQIAIYKWIFYPKKLYFGIPIYGYKETFRFGKDYTIPLFISRFRSICLIRKIYFDWVILGNIPILNRVYNFLIKGLPPCMYYSNIS